MFVEISRWFSSILRLAVRSNSQYATSPSIENMLKSFMQNESSVVRFNKYSNKACIEFKSRSCSGKKGRMRVGKRNKLL